MCNCEFPKTAFQHIENPKLISLMLPIRYPDLIHTHDEGRNRFVYRIEHPEGVTVTFSRSTKSF